MNSDLDSNQADLEHITNKCDTVFGLMEAPLNESLALRAVSIGKYLLGVCTLAPLRDYVVLALPIPKKGKAAISAKVDYDSSNHNFRCKRSRISLNIRRMLVYARNEQYTT